MLRCANGHVCDDDALYCDTCGVALAATDRARAQDAEPWQGGLSGLADDVAWPPGAEQDATRAVAGGEDSQQIEPHPEMPGAQGRLVDRRRGVATVRGVARGVQQRSEPWGQGWTRQILGMRVEQYDASGNRLQPVPVELRGWTLSGQISEGEEVEVNGRWDDGLLRASRATNVSTGGTVDTHRMRYIVLCSVAIAILIGFAVGLLVLG